MGSPVNCVSACVPLPSWTSTSRLTAFLYSSSLTQSQPPSASTSLLNHSLQVHLQTCSLMAYKCISKLTRLQPTSIVLNSHNYSLQVRMIMAFNCIPEQARLQPLSASLNLLDYGFGGQLSAHSITVWWNGGNGRQVVHHWYSATHSMVSAGNFSEMGVPAWEA
jgi:hypothetical protein